jgi:hypothetical protein
MSIYINDDKLTPDDVSGIEDPALTEIPEFNLGGDEGSEGDEGDEGSEGGEGAEGGEGSEGGEGAEGGEAKTAEQIAAEQKLLDDQELEKAANAEADRKRLRAEFLAEMGFKSEEELKALKNPAIPETEEQKAVRLEREEAAFIKHVVDNGTLSLNEINSFKQLSALPANDLVFADFANEYKDANKDRKDSEGEADLVTDEEIKDAFESIYNTSSENPALKKAGERALNARAKEILGETETKYKEARDNFNGLMDIKAKMPEFKSFVQSTLKTVIPEKMTFTSDGQEFHVELDGTDMAEIEKKFKDDNIFAQYYDTTDRQGFAQSIKDEASRQLFDKYKQKIIDVAYTSGASKGLKNGKVGARAPFDPAKKVIAPAQTSRLTEEEKAHNRAGLI